jgi:hypothetical protein
MKTGRVTFLYYILVFKGKVPPKVPPKPSKYHLSTTEVPPRFLKTLYLSVFTDWYQQYHLKKFSEPIPAHFYRFFILIK